MGWKELLATRDIQPHQTSRQEIDNLRALIARDLRDAAISALSPDRRFATAYNAALQGAKMAIACSGYRVTARSGHHAVTLDCLVLAIGSRGQPFVDYLDTCRRKRNAIDYSFSDVATETEADEIVREAGLFLNLIENWIVERHSHLAR